LDPAGRSSVDDGVRDGLTTAEQAEVVQLRRDERRLEMENEILRARRPVTVGRSGVPVPRSSLDSVDGLTTISSATSRRLKLRCFRARRRRSRISS